MSSTMPVIIKRSVCGVLNTHLRSATGSIIAADAAIDTVGTSACCTVSIIASEFAVMVAANHRVNAVLADESVDVRHGLLGIRGVVQKDDFDVVSGDATGGVELVL